MHMQSIHQQQPLILQGQRLLLMDKLYNAMATNLKLSRECCKACKGNKPVVKTLPVTAEMLAAIVEDTAWFAELVYTSEQ